MKKGLAKIIMTAGAFAVVTGCSTVPAQQPGETYDPSILSAAQVDAMIRVEVKELEPIAVEDTVQASAGFDRR